MKRTKGLFRYGIILFLSLLITGCGKTNTVEDSFADIPLYAKETRVTVLNEESNPYMMCFSDENFFFFSMDYETSSEENPEDVKTIYNFFIQRYDSDLPLPLFTLSNGYVKDLACPSEEGKEKLYVLTVGDKALIQGADSEGNSFKDIILPDKFNDINLFPAIFPLSDGSFLVTLDKEICHIDHSGNILGTVLLDGTASDFAETSTGDIYTLCEISKNNQQERTLLKIDLKNHSAAKIKNLPEKTEKILLLNGDLVAVTDKNLVFINENEDLPFVDLDKQSLIGAQIRHIVGNSENMKIIMPDVTANPAEIYHITLKSKDTESTEAASTTKTEDYTEDGRRIIRVAIPENCVYQTEFHAKKYNKISDTYFVKVERFSESTENYLGRGNHPDIIMFTDNAEADAFVKKGALTDFAPIYENQDKYCLDDMLPEVREILGFNNPDSLYTMGGRFRLLLRSSNQTEYNLGENITVTD